MTDEDLGDFKIPESVIDGPAEVGGSVSKELDDLLGQVTGEKTGPELPAQGEPEEKLELALPQEEGEKPPEPEEKLTLGAPKEPPKKQPQKKKPKQKKTQKHQIAEKIKSELKQIDENM